MTPDLLAQVEEAGLNASAPPQQRLLDGWLLRFSPGKAKRARCVNAISAGRITLTDKLARCEAAYAEAGLPMVLRITPFSEPANLDAELAARGFHRFDETQVMVRGGDVEPLAVPPLPSGLQLRTVDLGTFARIVGTLRGSAPVQQQAHAQRLQLSPVPFVPHVLEQDGEVLCCAQSAREGSLVGLYDVFTAPAFRGRGHADLLCRLLLSQAASRARIAYLQVEVDNTPARALYRRLGFQDAYAYHYRAREPRAA